MKTIGVIGYGSIGKRHADNLQAMGHTVNVYDPEQGFTTYPKAVDAYVIASPTNLHLQHMQMAMFDYGKDVFVEKPIAHKLDVDLKSDHILMVGYNLRFHSCVKAAKQWLAEGRVGDLLWADFICAQHNDKPIYLRDGVILNWSHEIDLALYLLGPAEVVGSSTRLTDGHDDMTDILLAHAGGVRSSIHLDYLTDPEIRGFTIVGTKGTINANLVSRRAWCGDNYARDVDDSWDANYVEEMKAFIDRIDGKETIGCTAQEGLDVLKICLEVRKQAGLS